MILIAHRLSTVINADKIAVIGKCVLFLRQTTAGNKKFQFCFLNFIEKKSTKPTYKDNGVIVEIGKHDELIAKKGAYYSLVNSQM